MKLLRFLVTKLGNRNISGLATTPAIYPVVGAPKLSHNVLDILRNIFVTLTVVYYEKYTFGLIEIHNINGFYCDLDDFTRIRNMYESPF